MWTHFLNLLTFNRRESHKGKLYKIELNCTATCIKHWGCSLLCFCRGSWTTRAIFSVPCHVMLCTTCRASSIKVARWHNIPLACNTQVMSLHLHFQRSFKIHEVSRPVVCDYLYTNSLSFSRCPTVGLSLHIFHLPIHLESYPRCCKRTCSWQMNLPPPKIKHIWLFRFLSVLDHSGASLAMLG